MKKYNRQRMILDIIQNNPVQTQDQLAEYLKNAGISATQATISRDIKELRITKVQSPTGEYRYQILDTVQDSLNERLRRILRSSILSITSVENLIIIQTVLYCAQVCGMTITNAKVGNIAGIVTGEDTIFIAIKDRTKVDETMDTLKELLR